MLFSLIKKTSSFENYALYSLESRVSRAICGRTRESLELGSNTDRCLSVLVYM